MERLVTVTEMANRYGCSRPTARKYLRQCVPHLEDPLVAPEYAVIEWEEKRTVVPVEMSRIAVGRTERQNTGRIIVPRHRQGGQSNARCGRNVGSRCSSGMGTDQ